MPGSGASAAFNIDLNFGGVSQLAADTQVQVSNQNGHAAGSLDSFAIGNDGTIVGIFTNGLTRNLGQVAMANFSNIAGLQREGNNLWRETNNSGLPMIGTAGTGGRGFMSAGFLEQSNVDIGQEFTDLIALCMEKLDKRHREILTMRNILNLPYEEISRSLGINVGTVKSRIARARENLRKLLSEAAPEFTPESDAGDFFESSRTAHGCHTIAYA